jgi:ABC-type glutathione transport system ATPase component
LSVGEAVFAIRRYDRVKGYRVHQEDFAQLTNTPPDKKYDHITYEQMGVLALSLLGEEGLREYLSRLLFMVASGNADAHLKNWSIYYPRREAQWSPPGGERQRLAIARALANEPSILLADEPTGSLDPTSAGQTIELFRRLRDEHGTTIVMVTHDREMAAAADRMVVIESGRIVE